MADPTKQYTGEIHDDLKYWAAWLPGTLIKLGDCGSVDDHVFNRRSSLESFGISFQPEERGTPGDLKHESSSGVTIDFQATGENKAIPGLPAGAAGAGVTFSKESGVVFAAGQCVETQIGNLDQLASDLKERYNAGVFPGHYVVVTAVVSARSATVLISRSGNGAITLHANADVPLGDVIDLANVEAKFSISRTTNMATQYVAESNLTPLFRVMGFERKWWNGEPKNGLEELGAPDEAELSEADFAEYVVSR
jgi:hypothetical protein